MRNLANAELAGITAKNPVLYERALTLARFLHRSERVALQIATWATSQLERAQEHQFHRLKYPPRTGRTKVIADDGTLLTRLAFSTSEHYEHLEEAAGQGNGLTQDDMTVRFVKQIVYRALAHNSHYAAVGIGQILYQYSTAEVMELYDTIAPSQSFRKAADHFRRVKAILFQDVQHRFAQQIRMAPAISGSKRFACDPDQSGQLPVVQRALALFAPQRPHPDAALFHEYDYWTDSNEDDRNRERELLRLHVLVDPHCFERLTAARHLAPPASRLSKPSFNIPGALGVQED
jgi:hypothetical protein